VFAHPPAAGAASARGPRRGGVAQSPTARLAASEYWS
jgi:hypothetical protein